MHKLYIFLFLFIGFNIFGQKNGSIPKNFSEFTKSPSNGENFKRIETDLDGDYMKDFVTVIHNKTYNDLHSNKKYLLIYLTSLKKNILIDFDTFNGRYFIAPRVKNKTMEFQIFEEGTRLTGHNLKLRFNSKKRKMQLIGYDYSYRVPGGHCNKSYNLLTGKYEVINDYYDLKLKKTKIERFSGKEKILKPIFTKDFSPQLFDTLSEVGSKFERD